MPIEVGPAECGTEFNDFVNQQGVGADQHFCAVSEGNLFVLKHAIGKD